MSELTKGEKIAMCVVVTAIWSVFAIGVFGGVSFLVNCPNRTTTTTPVRFWVVTRGLQKPDLRPIVVPCADMEACWERKDNPGLFWSSLTGMDAPSAYEVPPGEYNVWANRDGEQHTEKRTIVVGPSRVVQDVLIWVK